MSSNKMVLVICHTATGRMYLGVLLKRIWYTPLLADTVEDGIRIADHNSVKLIIVDSDVAEPDLTRTLLLLKNQPSTKNIPLVLVMTSQNAEMHKDLLATGCAAILTKPMDLSLVYGVLGNLTDEQRSAPRINTKFLVAIKEETPAKELVCINLSEGGMYLRTPKPLGNDRRPQLGAELLGPCTGFYPRSPAANVISSRNVLIRYTTFISSASITFTRAALKPAPARYAR